MEENKGQVVELNPKTEEQKKEEVKEEKKKFFELIKENPALLVPFATVASMTLKGIFSVIFGISNKSTANCFVEDDVTKLKYLTDHPLTNREILELSSRKTYGNQTTGEALADMDLLKNEKRRK